MEKGKGNSLLKYILIVHIISFCTVILEFMSWSSGLWHHTVWHLHTSASEEHNCFNLLKGWSQPWGWRHYAPKRNLKWGFHCIWFTVMIKKIKSVYNLYFYKLLYIPSEKLWETNSMHEITFILFSTFTCLGVIGTVHLILVINIWNMVAISSNFHDYIKKKLNKLA